MRNLWRLLQAEVNVPVFTKLDALSARLTGGSRTLFYILCGLLLVSTAGLLYQLEARVTVDVPARGGSLSEGIVGSPRFINPILAISDTDRDLTALVYSGLVRAQQDGSYAPDLAESYSISPDGRTYTFLIRPDAKFENGTPVTADDIIFTVQKAQDPALKSPLQANWEGVTVTKVNELSVSFTLKAAYAPFIGNLDLGILPKSLWRDVSDDQFPYSELNSNPVGSGPYKVASIGRSQGGIPSSYSLRANAGYALGEPYLTNFTLNFYQSEDSLAQALSRGDVDAAGGLSPENLTGISKDTLRSTPLNRVFGVFFNQNQSVVLRDKDVRVALNAAVDRTELVDKVLLGYGTALYGPVPPTLAGADAGGPSPIALASTSPVTSARNYLLAHGWVAGADGVLTKTTGKGKTLSTTRLQFILSTANIPELVASAQFLKSVWSEIGAQVGVQVFEQGDLAQNVIRPRKYDALLFGEVVGRQLDLYAFWHSSERNDPGLNIAMYANTTVDKALVALRSASDAATRAGLYHQIKEQLDADVPAVFLYAPDFVYSIPNDIKGVTLGFIETPSDRFLSIPQWYVERDRVWPFFAPPTSQ